MIRGTTRPVPSKKMTLAASIHNRFDIEVCDAETGEIRQRAQGFNVICEALWDQLLYYNGSTPYRRNYFDYILYGDGSGTPSASDTALFSRLGAISTGYYYNKTLQVERENSLAYAQAVGTLQAEDAVGETLTEVGIGYDTTHCVTHAMLVDMNGNPISITKTNTDVIKIYATVYVHWASGGYYNGAINLDCNGSDGDFLRTLTGCNSQTAGEWKFYVNYTGRGWASNTYKNAVCATSISRAERKLTITKRLAAADSNFPTRYIIMHNSAYYNYGENLSNMLVIVPGSWYSPQTIRGEAIGTGDGTATEFSTAFPIKSGAQVYIDGNPVAATVRGGAEIAANAAQYFNLVSGFASGNPYYHDRGWSYDDNKGPIAEIDPGGSAILENPFYTSGVAQFVFNRSSSASFNLQASADGITWTTVGDVPLNNQTMVTLEVPTSLQTSRYWKITNAPAAGSKVSIHFKPITVGSTRNISFASPPPAGSVITADYVPDCIAKDENHVFDLTLELTLGEYTGG